MVSYIYISDARRRTTDARADLGFRGLTDARSRTDARTTDARADLGLYRFDVRRSRTDARTTDARADLGFFIWWKNRVFWFRRSEWGLVGHPEGDHLGRVFCRFAASVQPVVVYGFSGDAAPVERLSDAVVD